MHASSYTLRVRYQYCSIPHPALLHRHTLILDRLFTFLMAFSNLVLKLTFSPSLSIHSRLSLPQAGLELSPLGVWQSLAAVVLVIAAD